jgi:subtilisin-like proprotein convertase family protein
MNTKKTILLMLGFAGLVNYASGQWLTNSSVLFPYVSIPDGNPVGWNDQFTMSGIVGTVADISVTLDINGGYNGDLYAYLVSPQGQMSVLLNRPGVTQDNPFGYGDAGLNITLDSAAINNIHNYGLNYNLDAGGQVTGTWGADGRNIDPQSIGSAFDAAPVNASLNIFVGQSGYALNGTWTIFVEDTAVGGGSPTLNSFGLEIMTIPEPSSLLLFGLGLACISPRLYLLWSYGKKKH